jgi:hypothetical protein
LQRFETRSVFIAFWRFATETVALQSLRMKNKRAYFILWFVAGSLCGGQAIHYFISGKLYDNSYLISLLVVVQLLFGIGVAFYGWKNFRLISDQNRKEN